MFSETVSSKLPEILRIFLKEFLLPAQDFRRYPSDPLSFSFLPELELDVCARENPLRCKQCRLNIETDVNLHALNNNWVATSVAKYCYRRKSLNLMI